MTSTSLCQQLIEQLAENQQGYTQAQNIINQQGLINIHRVSHSTWQEYALFSSAHRIYSKTDHILCVKQTSPKAKESESYREWSTNTAESN